MEMIKQHASGNSGIAERAITFKTSMTERWSIEWLMKTDPWNHPPHKALGGFGAYLGFTLAEAQACIRECFEVVDALIAAGKRDQLDPLTWFLFGRHTVESSQLWCFAECPDVPLHARRLK
jgi:hypothetical protein